MSVIMSEMLQIISFSIQLRDCLFCWCGIFNICFFDVFRGYGNKTLDKNGLTSDAFKSFFADA